MITIGRMPQKVQRFFSPLQGRFGKKAFVHFWQLVLALTISHGATLDRLSKLLRNSTHRTKHGEFLWQSNWEAHQVIQQIALNTLKKLGRKKASELYFIIDETQTLKRARKMAGVGKLFHHASGKYGTGHTMLKVCLWYRGVIIPWGTWLYLKKEDAQQEKIPFRKLTQLAAEAIRQATLPICWKVTVLFDCYYLCPTVVEACRTRGWHYIGVGKQNRRFFVQGASRRLGRYGRNLLRRRGRWYRIRGLAQTRSYQLAERVGSLKKLGTVKIVFSRRRGERNLVALVTDNLCASQKRIVSDYLKRWAIELEKLTILPSGAPPQNPSELISSAKMAALIQELKARYNDRYIIFDSPPPMMAPETSAIATSVDGILLVVKYGDTSMELVEELMTHLDR